MKFCKDCKWMLDRGEQGEPLCGHENAMEPVHGNPQHCDPMRRSGSGCGPAASWFEPIDEQTRLDRQKQELHKAALGAQKPVEQPVYGNPQHSLGETLDRLKRFMDRRG